MKTFNQWLNENSKEQKSLINGIVYKAKDILNFVADGDLQSISEWMDVPLESLNFSYRLQPIALFAKQAEEMLGTYEEFPEDEVRTNKILKIIKKQPLYPVFVKEGDKDSFIMEGRHRIVAFWQAGIKQIPVFYVSEVKS